jgi:UDP-3-O-[3-hydroxymyristoyl] glucosamine N-acyltransferase
MHFEKPVPLTEIAELIGATIIGKKEGLVSGINEIHKVEEGDLVFVDHPKYYNKCTQSAATYIIINQSTDVPEGKALLLVNDPFEAYQTIVQHFRPFQPVVQAVSSTATIGKHSILMHGAVIGNHVSIGDDCVIHPNVVIMDHCIIGNDVVIQSGTIIGSDAFYYNKKTNRDVHFKRMNSCGRVVIEDFVEIGANCTIDRGVTSDTIIGRGTKLDNLVHIGHDTIVGKNCLVAAQVGVAGVVTIEDEVMIWGQAGINKTLTIGKGAEVFAQSGVPGDLEAGKKYFGSPAEEALSKRKELVWIKRIPELWTKVMGNEKG